jgi:hypothetical protein
MLVAMQKLSGAQESEIKRIIQSGNLADAIECHRQMYPPAGDGHLHETDTRDLRECLSTPLPLFSFCSDAELLELRLRMATALVVGGRLELIPDATFPWEHRMTPKAAAHNFFASITNHRNVSQWRRSNVVLTARIQNSLDGPCSSCKEAAREYALAGLPSVPIHTCENINTVGCRCVAVAMKIRGINL